MTQARGLRPRFRYTFRSGDLTADISARKVLAMQAVRVSTELSDAASAGDDVTAVRIMAGLIESSIDAVHSLSLTGADGTESLDSPTVSDLLESLDAAGLRTLFADLTRGPQADFAQPASGSGHA